MNIKTMRHVATLVVVASLAFAPSALAQGSSTSGYNPPGAEVENLVGGGANDGGPTGTASADEAGGLPFTGLDLSLALGGGLVLLLAGLGLSRALSRDTAAV